jgi:8-oxo-dGTP pyrophosphatase MutT (NUDIX family)
MKTFNKVWLDSIQNKMLSFPNCIMPIVPQELIHRASISNKKAAVFVSLCNRFGVASVLFTIRSTSVRTHKGQVSFPGGHVEDGETAVEAAFRETYEELGPIGDLTFLGVAQQIPAITGTLVTPVIGLINNDVLDFDHFTPNDQEVAKIFTVSIDKLFEPSFRKTESLVGRGIQMDFPYFGEKGDPECIWGLSGMILDSVLRELILPTMKDIDMMQNSIV